MDLEQLVHAIQVDALRIQREELAELAANPCKDGHNWTAWKEDPIRKHRFCTRIHCHEAEFVMN